MLNASTTFRGIAFVVFIIVASGLQGCSADSDSPRPTPYAYSENEIYPVVIGDDPEEERSCSPERWTNCPRCPMAVNWI